MKQKTALVTGANKGIGFEICRQLAEKDFQVFLAARDPGRGSEAVANLQRAGLRVKLLHLDVANIHSIEKVANELAASMDHLNVLVNNAGIYEDQAFSILDVDPQLVRKTLETNTVGPLLMIQRLWPLIAKSGWVE